MLPEVTTCPGCKHDDLAIYMDPTSADSNRWMYCHHCGFRGDSLELYALTRRTRDMFDTVERASTDGSFTLEASNLTPEAVFNYIEYFPVRRRKTEALWKQFRAGLGPRLSADLSRRMQNMHLWSTWNYGQGMIGRFMGGATRHEVNKAFGEEILPKEGNRPIQVTTIPFQSEEGEWLVAEVNVDVWHV